MSIKQLIQRITEELPNLNPNSVTNSTPGRSGQVDLLDADNNVIDTIDITLSDEPNWIGVTWNGSVVSSIRYAFSQETITQHRREDRELAFAETIDRMNVDWYNDLTDDQRLRLRAYRLAWLDWPSSNEIEFPTTFYVDDENENVSTDVSDIFN